MDLVWQSSAKLVIIWQSSANLLPLSMVSGICCVLAVSTVHSSWTFLKSDCERAEDTSFDMLVAGPSAWNVLPLTFKNSTLSLPTFRHQLKHFYFSYY